VANVEGLSVLREKVDQAFEFRGNVHVDLGDGRSEEGYLFNRGHETQEGYASGFVELFRKSDGKRLRLGIDQIVDVRLTGRDHYKPFVPESG
jgi:hypothetical protein